MNEHVVVGPEKAMIDSIVAETDARVRSLLERAEETARSEAENAKKNADKVHSEILDRARRDAAKTRSRAVASARIEARRILLRAREDAISTVVARIEGALRGMRTESARYRAALVSLLAEAILAVDEEHVKVTLSAADRAIVDGTVTQEAVRLVKEVSGREVGVDVHFEDTDLGGGCRVTSKGGRVLLDNTFARRLEEAKRHLRPLIAEELEKSRG